MKAKLPSHTNLVTTITPYIVNQALLLFIPSHPFNAKKTTMGFQTFHERWHQQLEQLVLKLKAAPRPPSSDDQNNHLLELINSFLAHISDYYQVKSAVAHQDVLFLLAAPWASTFERSLHWLAGWRPTTAFQIVHTESTILFENRMLDILDGRSLTGDLADLSPDQFKCLSNLQCVTAQEENALSEQLSEWQARLCPKLSVV